MSVRSTTSNECAPKEGAYPLLMRHKPTHCVVLFRNATEGVCVWAHATMRSASIGGKWNMCSRSNYELFTGTVELKNED